MKKRKPTMFLLISASVFLVIGIIILSIGVIQGGDIYFKQHRYGPISTIIFSDKNDGFYQEYTSKYDISSIEIDADLGDITLKAGSTYKVEFINFDKNEVSYENNKGKVEINTHTKSFGISLSGINNDGREIILTVPKTCIEVDIEANLGSVYLSGLHLKEANISLDIGSIDINDAVLGEATFILDVGDLDYQGEINKTLEAKAACGEINITLDDKKEHYAYKLKTDLGSIEIDGDHMHSKYEVNTHSTPLIEAKANLGSIEIDFEN